MTDIELLTKIKESLQRLSLPIAAMPGERSLLTGYCQIQGEADAFKFIIKVLDGYATIYMIAPYGNKAFDENGFYEALAVVNLALGRGHFNADSSAKTLIYKWVLPAASFVEDCDKATKEFVVLPAAMIIKYKDKFVRSKVTT